MTYKVWPSLLGAGLFVLGSHAQDKPVIPGDSARGAGYRFETVRSFELHGGEYPQPWARIAVPKTKYGVPARRPSLKGADDSKGIAGASAEC